MPGHDYDLFVIGGGSGGVRAARMAAGTGASHGVRRLEIVQRRNRGKGFEVLPKYGIVEWTFKWSGC